MRYAWFFILSLFLASCSPGQLLGPIFTPTPSITSFFTPTFTSSRTPSPTLTSTPTPSLTATLVPLGGTNVAYIEDSELFREPFPDSLQQYLVPSPPEQWEKVSQYQVSDGTTVPWGASVILRRSDGRNFAVLPALIRGKVTIADPNQFARGSIIYVVYEFPAQGGSNFIVQSFLDNKFSTVPNKEVEPLKGPIPVSWLKSDVGSPISTTEFDAETSFAGDITEKQYAEQLAAHQGEMVLLVFPVGGSQVEIDALHKIIDGQMMGDGKISGIEDAMQMIGPQRAP